MNNVEVALLVKLGQIYQRYYQKAMNQATGKHKTEEGITHVWDAAQLWIAKTICYEIERLTGHANNFPNFSIDVGKWEKPIEVPKPIKTKKEK